MTRYKKRNLLIAGLCAIVLVMAIGYAAFSSRLNISGTSNITSKWKIAITNIVQKEIGGEAIEKTTPTFDSLNANFGVGFNKPGDYVTYTVTVANQGTLNAVLDNIKIDLEKTDIVSFKVDGISSGDALNVNEEKQFDVTFKYNENITSQPDKTDFSVSMELNFLQEGNSTDFSGADSPSVDILAINSINLTPSETTIDVSVNASNATKYYYSLDNDKYFEALENSYIFSDLKILTEYTVWVKAEDSDGNVAVDSKKVTTVDTTKPNIKITEKELVEGNNGYNKGVTLTSAVTDNGKVSSVMYCASTGKTCAPNKEATLTNGKFDYIFEANKDAQTLCVKATDSANNENTECSSSYFVDNANPTLDTITVTPDDDTMSIEVTGTDNESGLYKYYFSKDSGNTYVESNNSNYTFTELEEGDYLVTVYAEDKAGNKSELTAASTTIRHSAFCLHNDITNLTDCIIATEAGNIKDIGEAKTIIEAKAQPDFTKISPSIVYEKSISGLRKYNDTRNYLNIGTSYTFNEKTGNYTIPNTVLTNLETIDFTSGDYYSTWSGTGGTVSDPIIYKIVGIDFASEKADGTKVYTISYYMYGQKPKQYDSSNTGMYAIDDGDGKSYYYRGSVGGNYVKFAEKYWRIIRINGDGTLRLIYDGTSVHTNSEITNDKYIGNSTFNQLNNDNTYVGYMYGDETNFIETNSGTVVLNHSGLSNSAKYYFGTNYEFDKEKKTFKLSGNLINGTVANDKVGYYTCFSTSATGTCKKIEYTTKYINSTALQTRGISYGTKSYNESIANVNDSQIKSYLENWYINNLSKYNDKIFSLSKFCNDRSLSPYKEGSYSNKGYGLEFTTYGVYSRLFSWAGSTAGSPTLLCPSKNDTFTLTEANGNGKLKQPIGLITADEANLAGGTTFGVNKLYYLYNGYTELTMTPSYFGGSYTPFVLSISEGKIKSHTTTADFKIRPVINIDPSKITFTGIGTKEDPFVIN